MAPLFGRGHDPETFRTPPPLKRSEVEDRRVAACPYCGVALKKVPGAATTCPSCRETMFVRTNQRSRVRMVVTWAEADEIDDVNEAITAGNLDAYDARVTRCRDDLRSTGKFGPSPAYADVRWRMLNEDVAGALATKDPVVLLLAHRRMLEVLRRRRATDQALELALTVFYLEQCGEPVRGYDIDRGGADTVTWQPLATPSQGSLSAWVGRECEGLGVSVEEAARRFDARADGLRRGFGLPLSWARIWPECV